MIAKDSGWIFVHIQKCGGNSARAALGVEIDDAHKHFSACELRKIYGEDVWRKAFKFSFVRNPWDRLVSWWANIDANRPAMAAGRPLNKFHYFVLERATTFEEFLENCDEEIIDSDGRKWIYRNQSDYLTDASGKMLVDFVGRFETLQQDYAFISKKIGSTAPLPHTNRSTHGPYTDYYTQAMAAEVARRYRADIERFGYVFGQ
jgi:Sulfotransferase family